MLVTIGQFAVELDVSLQAIRTCAGAVVVQARNIACHVQLKEYDSETSPALDCIYQRTQHAGSLFTDTARCGVLHHSSSPDFTEEVIVSMHSVL